MWGKEVVSAEREEHIDGDQTSRQLDGKNVEWMEQVSDDQSRWRTELRNAPCHTSSSNSGQEIGAAETRLAAAITKDVASVLNYGDESVSVALEEVAAAEWAEKVYRPDIVEKAATLYKKPGYEM